MTVASASASDGAGGRRKWRSRPRVVGPVGVEMTLNYFYQRFGGDDGTNYAPLKGVTRTFDPVVDARNFVLEKRLPL